MAGKKKGEPVNKVIIQNPVAVSIVNERANRDHLDAGTAAAVMLIEHQNQQSNPNGQAARRQAKRRRNFLQDVVTKGGGQ